MIETTYAKRNLQKMCPVRLPGHLCVHGGVSRCSNFGLAPADRPSAESRRNVDFAGRTEAGGADERANGKSGGRVDVPIGG